MWSFCPSLINHQQNTNLAGVLSDNFCTATSTVLLIWSAEKHEGYLYDLQGI
jgi:hypothetical protein